MERAYYNEIDPFAAQWLRNLIEAGHIAPGDVDERSIEDVRASDLVGYRQCHFFAGIGVWSYALRLAGWSDERPVWTGSCPCQPFSDAGAGAGFEDVRHLWPVWANLIRERRPVAVFGEQVAGRNGLAWFDFVHADLEAAGYAVGCADLCAAGFGAPHIRQRLFFVADAGSDRTRQHARELHGDEGQHEVGAEDGDHAPVDCGAVGGMADAHKWRSQEQPPPRRLHGDGARRDDADGCGADGSLDDATVSRLQIGTSATEATRQGSAGIIEAGPVNGFWRDAEWLPCIDGKARPVEPGTFPLAHGAAARVGRLRAYGNAINAEVARHFIEAYVRTPDYAEAKWKVILSISLPF